MPQLRILGRQITMRSVKLLLAVLVLLHTSCASQINQSDLRRRLYEESVGDVDVCIMSVESKQILCPSETISIDKADNFLVLSADSFASLLLLCKGGQQ